MITEYLRMIFRSVYSIRHNAAPKKKAHIRKMTVGNIKSALHVCSLLYPGDSWALFSSSPFTLIPDELAKFLGTGFSMEMLLMYNYLLNIGW